MRLFGFHVWAVALPQAVEGTLTVLVLFRAVRRVAGAGAGLTAAVVLAATPVMVLLNRGNVSDSLLILLLVLAADAATRAFLTGRLASLLLAGVWVGLAFQAKMLQAWIVLPALFLAYLLAAPVSGAVPATGARRPGRLWSSLVVSLSWMCVVSLVPAHDRPYVDGSCNNSVFSQVFLYNGADRLTGDVLDQPGCRRPPAASTLRRTPRGTVPLGKGPGRFLERSARARRRLYVRARPGRPRRHPARPRGEPEHRPLRAAAVLWALWMVFTWAFFASSQLPQRLLPGRAGAAAGRAVRHGTGTGLAYAPALAHRDAGRHGDRRRRGRLRRRPGAGTASACGPSSWRRRSWPPRRPSGCWPGRSSRAGTTGTGRAGLVLSAVALLLGPAWASRHRGRRPSWDRSTRPTSPPPRPGASTPTTSGRWPPGRRSGPTRRACPAVSVETAETSADVAFDVLGTGREFLPVGGFTGRVPSITVPRFVADVRAGRISWVLVATRPPSRNPDLRWVTAHCPPAPRSPLVRGQGYVLRHYRCTATDAAG